MTVRGSLDSQIPKAAARTGQCLSLLELEGLTNELAETASLRFQHLQHCAYCRDKLTEVQNFEARAYREPEAGPQCLPLLVLEGIVDNPADFPETSLARRHLEFCSYCLNKVAMLRSFEAGPTRETHGPTYRRHRFVLKGLALAASVMTAVGVGFYFQRDVHPAPEVAPVYRSLQFKALSPAGSIVSTPEVFRWQMVAGASVYRLHLMEVDRTEVWSVTTAESNAPAPPEVRQRMKEGTAFLWTVDAQNAAGEKIAETSLQRFNMSILTRPARRHVE